MTRLSLAVVVVAVTSSGVTSCGGNSGNAGVSAAAPDSTAGFAAIGVAAPRGTLLSSSSGIIDLDGNPSFQESSPIGAGRARQFFPSYMSPLAVIGSDSRVFYNAVGDSGRPEVRVADPARGSDELAIGEAFSIALDRAGRLAYVDASLSRDPVRDGGVVAVREAAGQMPTAWSDAPGKYVVLAWARDKLLVRRAIDGTEAGDLVVLDGPQRQRVLASRSELLAVNGDGTTVLVGSMADDASSYALRLMDVTSGTTMASLESVANEPIKPVVSAAWNGDKIVASGTVAQGTVTAILALTVEMSSENWSIEVDRVIELGRDVLVPDEIWLSADGTTVFGIAFPPQESDARGQPVVKPLLFLKCSLGGAGCSLEDMPELTNTQVARVRNPSRPVNSDATSQEAS